MKPNAVVVGRGPGFSWRRGLAGAVSLVALLVSSLAAWAYPPSPYHLLYGLVRDQYGMPLANSQIKILLVSTNGTQSQTTIQPNLAVGINYMLPVPLDTMLKPDLYRSNALSAGSGFTLYVVVGTTTNVPLISSSTVTNLGQPTGMSRIDLTLGTDSNHDGIPDEWEQAFLAALGSNLTLADLNANLDVAHDGRTLAQEYLLGTVVSDPDNPFAVRMVNFNGGAPILEFPTMTGRSYTVWGSANLRQWTPLSFRLSGEDPATPAHTNYTATAIQTLQLQVIQTGPAAPAQFFRLSLQ